MTDLKNKNRFLLLSSVASLLYAIIFYILTCNLLASFFTYILEIPFRLQPMFMPFVTSDATYWDIGNLFIVYGIAPILLFAIGFVLSKMIPQIKTSWTFKLFLLWVSLLMVVMLPAGLFAAAFSYDGIAILVTYIFPSFYIRLFIAAIGLIVCFLQRYYWLSLFELMPFSLSYLESDELKMKFLNLIFKFPLIIVLAILIVFFIFIDQYFLAISLAGLLITLASFTSYYSNLEDIRIKRANRQKNTLRLLISFITFAIIILLLMGLY